MHEEETICGCACAADSLMVAVGKVVPEFEVEAFQDEEIKKVKLSDYKGKWTVVFFYPGDFTFVCPTELAELSMHYEEFKKLDTEILSVSHDSVHVHKAWHDESEAIKGVKYPMVADPKHMLSKMFGVYLADEGVCLRGTFIIDPDGILRGMEVNDNSIGRNAKELMRKLKAAQFVRKHGDQVCPASWEEGDATLKPGLDLVGKI